jgi:hypothetical protein
MMHHLLYSNVFSQAMLQMPDVQDTSQMSNAWLTHAAEIHASLANAVVQITQRHVNIIASKIRSVLVHAC